MRSSSGPGWLPVLILLLVAFPVMAQDMRMSPAPGASIVVAEQLKASMDPIAERLAEIERMLDRQRLDESKLTELRLELENTDDRILDRVTAMQPQISAIDTRLVRLPPPPADGEPDEAEQIAAERKALIDARAKAILAIRDAELLAVRSKKLLDRVLGKRRSLFVSALLTKRTLDFHVIETVVEQSGGYAHAIWSTMSTWFTGLFRFNLAKLLLLLLLTSIVGLMLHMLLRPLRRWIAQIEAGQHLNYVQTLSIAFSSIVLPAAAMATLALTLHQLMGYLGLYRLRVDHIMAVLLTVLTGGVFVWLLLRAVLSPGDARHRLLKMTDRAAWRLMFLGLLMAVIHGLDYLATRLIDIFAMPVEFTVAKSLAATLLIALTLIAVVTTRLREPDPEKPQSGYRGWHPLAYWLIWLSIMAIVLAELSGYISLGRFIAGQIIITGSLVATMYIGYLASRAISGQGAMSTTRLGQRLRERRGMSDLRLDQLGLVLSVLINGAILLIGIPFLLLQWGFQADDMLNWLRAAVFGFSIGNIEISFGRIVVALLVFLIVIAFTRLVQRWFDDKVLARTQLDAGVKNSVKAGVGYVGFFVAAMVAISWAGFNLSNLALIAGALSVGIGFGLQNIVNNFVSGIIMLVERPIKVGDIIAVAGSEGFVRKINVRATELETFDRQSVIIPNSEVINTSVGNWMHTDSVRRIVIAVGVAYGSDIEKVREILLSTVEGDERIADFPEPSVYFADFGSSSLDFQLRFFLRDIMETPVVETDIRFAIDRLFRENGIEIPFPQQDLHIRSGLPEVSDD